MIYETPTDTQFKKNFISKLFAKATFLQILKSSAKAETFLHLGNLALSYLELYS
jgi:hypothetical protein